MGLHIVKGILPLVFLALFGNGLNSKEKDKVAVACVGDSVTFGARLEDPSNDSYPAVLQQLLGTEYHVVNLGVGSCTLIRKGKPTVWDQLSAIRDADPDIVVISLGINDTCGKGTCGDRKCWEYKDEYEGDYRDLIDVLRGLPSKPAIWICAPSPMVLETPGLSQERIEGLTTRKPRLQELIRIVRKVAAELETGFIDLNTPLDHHPELYTEKDGVHPNVAGYRAIAELVYDALKQ
jgi:sialate O-acetylesterase